MVSILRFKDADSYEQESIGDVRYKALLDKGELNNLGMGLVTLEGPASTLANSHSKWDQVYLIIKGQGSVILNGKKYNIKDPCVVKIPVGTKHSVSVDEGEELQYIYINAFHGLKLDDLDSTLSNGQKD